MPRPHSSLLPLLLSLLIVLAGCPLQQASKADADASPRRDMNQVLDEARSAYQARDWKTSERDYLLVVERSPSNIEAWFRLGNIYTRTNRPRLAARAYEEALLRDPENTKAWHNLGVIYLRQAHNSFRQQQVHARGDDAMSQADKKILRRLDAMLK